MSALIALILLAAAAWFVSNIAGATGVRREPIDSVSDFSRAMSALDPQRPAPRR